MPDIKEEWRDIEGYEGYYQVSNFGSVRRLLNRVGTKKLDAPIILKPFFDRRGYPQVALSKKNKRKVSKVHRIVAETFIQNHDSKPCVNHIDGNKQNNTVNNLEWCSYQSNTLHALQNGLKVPPKGEKVHNAVFTNEQAENIRKEYVKGSRLYGTTALGKKYGVNPSTIHLIIRNKHYK